MHCGQCGAGTCVGCTHYSRSHQNCNVHAGSSYLTTKRRSQAAQLQTRRKQASAERTLILRKLRLPARRRVRRFRDALPRARDVRLSLSLGLRFLIALLPLPPKPLQYLQGVSPACPQCIALFDRQQRLAATPRHKRGCDCAGVTPPHTRTAQSAPAHDAK